MPGPENSPADPTPPDAVPIPIARPAPLGRRSSQSTPGAQKASAAKSTASGATKAVGVVALAVMASRVLGLARDLIVAALFGAGRWMDAFLIAFRIPNLLRDLFAEGALSTAFVTVFSQKVAMEGNDAAWRLGRKVASLAILAVGTIVLLGMLVAPWLVALQAPGFTPEVKGFTADLLRIMWPFILLVSLAALAMGMLNARGIFGAPALASSFFNIGSIVGGVGMGYLFDPKFGPNSLVGLALGTLLGGALQFAVQLPSLKRAGFTWGFDPDWKDPAVRRVLALMGPAVIAGSAVQVNVVVNGVFASAQEGAVSWLQYAFRLMQLPLGVFGVAVATVTLPLVSKAAALNDMEGFRAGLGRGMRLAFFLTIPSAVGLICLAEPIIGLIFERGKFDHRATLETAAALQFYAAGLVGYAGIKVLAPAFNALNRPRIPMNVSFLSIGVNLTLNFAFTYLLGWKHRGLAFTTAAVAALNFVLLYVAMRRLAGRLEGGAMLRSLSRLALPAAGLAAVCLAADATLLGDFARWGLITKIAVLGGIIALSGGLFFVSCQLLGVPEMREAVDLVKRKLRRRR